MDSSASSRESFGKSAFLDVGDERSSRRRSDDVEALLELVAAVCSKGVLPHLLALFFSRKRVCVSSDIILADAFLRWRYTSRNIVFGAGARGEHRRARRTLRHFARGSLQVIKKVPLARSGIGLEAIAPHLEFSAESVESNNRRECQFSDSTWPRRRLSES